MLLLVFVGGLGLILAQDPVKELRPCFERYSNHRLVNVQPFHSEWRMRSEEHCLRFCALSSSRCRSIVYDSVQHICHYFLDEGLDMAVTAAKMIYLRVTSKQCLDNKLEVASTIEEITPETPPVIPSIPIEPETLPPPQQIQPPEETGFAGSFDVDVPEDNELRRDIQQEPERWQSSMEKVVKNDEDLMFKKPMGEEISAEVMMRSKEDLQDRLQKKLEMLQEKFPDKYVEYVKGSGEVTTTTEPITTTEKAQNMKKTAKVISYSKQAKIPKKISFKSNEIRRKPIRPSLKSVALPNTSIAEKARHFLASVNGDAEMEEVKPVTTTEKFELPSEGNGCDEDFTAVWVTFENSLDSRQSGIDSQLVENKEECQDICNQMNCRSFSFFDKESQCQINSKSDGVHLKASPQEDFSASTSTRFCFSKSLPVFHGCNNFIGFRDLSVQVQPREQFDGLPKGHAGMQYCIELCVLSSEYICRSASFLLSEGRCLLNSEDSLTKPDLFKPSLGEDHLYFENACSSPPPLKDDEKENVSIERVKPPKASPLKALQIKRLKPTALKVQNKENYKLTSNDENILATFFKKFF